MQYFSVFISLWIGFFLYLSSSILTDAATTYTPGAVISMTGSNGQVFFDVADDIYNSGTNIPYPTLVTATQSFSGAFYLTGAGWVDFSTGTYSVNLDCGMQSLGSLSTPCTLSGVAYSELIGDVTFDRRVMFDPTSGLLSGSASTYVGDYSFSGIILPLLPSGFVEGKAFATDHSQPLTLRFRDRHSGSGSWVTHIETDPGFFPIPYIPGGTDLSHAATYIATITDPDGGVTTIDDFTVRASNPSSTLYTTTFTKHAEFCTTSPASLSCPDNATLRPTLLEKTQSQSPMVANGVDTYSFVLKLRDRYGNLVNQGTVRIDYHDTVRTVQMSGNLPYPSPDGYALRTGGSMLSTYGSQTPSTPTLSANLGNISYTFASRAPTQSPTDMLVLSGVIYTPPVGPSIDISSASWKSPLTFAPWYSTSLSTGPLIPGNIVDFTSTFTSASLVPPPISPTAVYDIAIGNNIPSSFTGFTPSSSIYCTKYYFESGINECDWNGIMPVILSTPALSFSGLYSTIGPPTTETVSYRSYITYKIGVEDIRVLYPSASGNLGGAIPGKVKMKVLGQNNLLSISGNQEESAAQVWNVIQKNTALRSRNRSTYTDVDYSVSQGSGITVSDADFASKRTIVVVGGDITITTDIARRDVPLALIALSDRDGNGGKIHIDASVNEVALTLLAQKSVHSSGPNQLYILGSIISHNSESDMECPYFDSSCPDPALYNLENLRSDFLTAPSSSLAPSLGGKHPQTALVIEYDGRLLSDPPPIVDE